MIYGEWTNFKPRLAGLGLGGSVCGRARDEGKRQTVERLCVPGLPVCVSGPDRSWRAGGHVPWMRDSI